MILFVDDEIIANICLKINGYMLKGKFGVVLQNILRQGLTNGINFFFPLFIINYYSKNLWADFVMYSLYFMILMPIVMWGGKDFLIRQFSLQPFNISKCLQSLLLDRTVILVIACLFTFFLYPFHIAISIFIGVIGFFLNQVFSALVLYERSYKLSFAIELISFLSFILALTIAKERVDMEFLLRSYGVYQLLKGSAYLFVFRQYIFPWSVGFNVNISYLWKSAGMFVFSISGFLISKIDLYIISLSGNKTLIADYQLLNSVIINAIAISYLIYAPYQKSLYRNNTVVFHKIKKRLFTLGLVIIPLLLVLVVYVMRYFAHLEIHFKLYILLFFAILPSFIYGLDIVYLLKNKMEKKVIYVMGLALFIEACALLLVLNIGQTLSLNIFAVALGQFSFWLLLDNEVRKSKIKSKMN